MEYTIKVNGEAEATAKTKALAISIGKLLSRRRGCTVVAMDRKGHVVYYCEG